MIKEWPLRKIGDWRQENPDGLHLGSQGIKVSLFDPETTNIFSILK